MNKRLVLDVQGFKDENNKFLPKELAAYDGNKISHFIFKQPFAFNLLSPEMTKQAIWLMKHHHCITWNSGFTPLHSFAPIVKELTAGYLFVYVKGKEKYNFLKKYSSRPVIELDEQPVITPSTPRCFYHSKSPCICALSNVFFMYENFFMNE
jgi:hypothetical protein